MKKIVLALIVLLSICGCTNLREMDLKETIDTGVNRKISMVNQNRKGYKYYVPRGMKVIDYTNYNEKITDSNYHYYLYIDAVSYINKVIEKFEINHDAYYSKEINNKDKFGYIEIKKRKDNKYLVEIMYNYAKIEVIVNEKDINISVLNSLQILSSITYNDKIINNLIGEDILHFKETEFNIFKPRKDSNYLKYKEQEELIEDEFHDSDLIK